MKTLKYLFILLCTFSLAACFDDDTTLDTVRISEISIDTLKLKKTYNIDYNETLTISTENVVSESEAQLPLQYAWEVNYKLYSEEPNLEYVGSQIGTFPVRLKVSNEHGSSFYEFTINVNTAYQTGIAILSENNEGEPMFSFMRELSDTELAAGKKRGFANNCLQASNPDHEFPKNPTDFGIRKDQLFICFKNTPCIYMLNSSMLNIENIATDADPEFVPEKLIIANSAAKQAVVLTSNGKAYQFGSLEGIILPHTGFSSKYNSKIGMVRSVDQYTDVTIVWENQTPAIIDCVNSYFYYSTIKEGIDFTDHTPLALYNRNNESFTLLTRKNDSFMKTSINFNWKINDGMQDQYPWGPINERFGIYEKQVEVAGNPNFTDKTPYVSSPKYQCLYYAIGNNIYRWFYNNNSFPTTPWKTLNEINGAEVTALSISEDEEQLYVGVNDNSKNELSGSFYLLNSDTGKNEGDSPYLNIAHKPVRIMYKK